MIIIKERKYKKLSEYLWQIVLVAVGITCISCSFLFSKEHDRLFATFNGIGVSLLLSGLLGFFVRALFERKNAQNEVYEEWRLKNIYSSRAIANLMIDAYQEKAKKNVDIIAFGLTSWRQAKENLIDSMLNRKVRIRIITMNPHSEILAKRDYMEGKAQGSTKESILHLQEFFGKTNNRKKVEIKYHEQLPLDFYFRIDDHIFVGPYLFGKESQQMITYEFEKGGSGFSYYSDYFESLWNGSSVPNLEFVKVDTNN